MTQLFSVTIRGKLTTSALKAHDSRLKAHETPAGLQPSLLMRALKTCRETRIAPNLQTPIAHQPVRFDSISPRIDLPKNVKIVSANDVSDPSFVEPYLADLKSFLGWFQFAGLLDLDDTVVNPRTKKTERQTKLETWSSLIVNAFNLSCTEHDGYRRYSGLPYFSHPIDMVKLLQTLKLCDPAAICAILLHDVIEDGKSEIKAEELKTKYRFPKEVVTIVEGLTKIDNAAKINKAKAEGAAADVLAQMKKTAEVETWVKIVLSLETDPRILICKLLDVIHNLRTISYKPRANQVEFATTALNIYAPLADEMGLRELKNEIQDLAFAALMPEEFCLESAKREERVFARTEERDALIRNIFARLKRIYRDKQFSVHRTGWDAYECYKVREKKQIPIDAELVEGEAAFAFVCPDKTDLDFVVGAIMGAKDCSYISESLKPVRKPNGYQAKILRMRGKDGTIYNIQVQTQSQYEAGRRGIAYDLQMGRIIPGFVPCTDRIELIRSLTARVRKMSKAADIDLAEELQRHTEMVMVLDKDMNLHFLPKGSTYRDFAFKLGVNLGLTSQIATLDHSVCITNLGDELKPGALIEFGKKEKLEAPAFPPYKMLSEVTSQRWRDEIVEQRKKYPSLCLEDGKKMLEARLANPVDPTGLTLEDILGFHRITHYLDEVFPEHFGQKELKAALHVSRVQAKQFQSLETTEKHPHHLTQVILQFYEIATTALKKRTAFSGLATPNNILTAIGTGIISPEDVYFWFTQAWEAQKKKNEAKEIALQREREILSSAIESLAAEVERKNTPANRALLEAKEHELRLLSWPEMIVTVDLPHIEGTNASITGMLRHHNIGLRIESESAPFRAKGGRFFRAVLAIRANNRLDEIRAFNIIKGSKGKITSIVEAWKADERVDSQY